MTPQDIIQADAKDRLGSFGWSGLWTDPMSRRVADALSYLFGYAIGEHLWEIDVLAIGGLPYDFAIGNPHAGHYLLIAEVREEEAQYTGRRVAGLKAVFRRDVLSPEAWRRVNIVNDLFRRSVISVPYWPWREARAATGARPLPAKQTVIPDL